MIYNVGVSGDTSELVLERFENEIKARLSDEGEDIIIISIGINDSVYLNDQKNKDLL